MKKDTESWLRYADENLKSAEILMGSGLFNPSLQNAQQAVEKYLKAVLIEKAAGLTKTHSIRELTVLIEGLGVHHSLTDDDIDLLDSIYLPSKYPAFSVLPRFVPDESVCRQCLDIAETIRSDILSVLI